MPDRASDPAPPPPERDVNRVPALLVAAIREEAAHQGLTLSTLGDRAAVGDLLDRVAADSAHAAELRVSDLAAIARVLGVSASTLIARTEAKVRATSGEGSSEGGEV